MGVICALCNTSEAAIYCFNDAANLCSACYAQMHVVAHSNHKLTWKHQRVRLCETCKGEPAHATVYCEHDKAR